jgi:HAD superfamily hydrolase (TIGR01490 family)
VSEPPRTAAFFDVDNTVLRGASIFYFGHELYRRHFFGAGDLARMAWLQARYSTLGEKLEHVAIIRERALSFIAGRSVSEITAIGEHTYDAVMADRIWPGTYALALDHLAAGEQVWLVSATPIEMAQVIADRLGLTGALGTVAERVDGVYTGALVGEPLHGAVKADAVRALAEREGLDLAGCSAYSDSVHDVPLLELVGHPCAVNPDARLRAYARQRGWPVHDYRTAHRAARVGVPALAGLGAAASGVAAAGAIRRRRR